MSEAARIDHLVVLADTLEAGTDWCEATLGVVPAPGGEHPLFGTHNRLLRVATVDHPRAYFEIMAVQPGRAPQRPKRWFDLDDETLRDRLRRDGPRLAHFVAAVPDAARATTALRGLGIDRGEVLEASRMTPRGLLRWQITVRADGQRLFDGALPTLIQWGDVHPTPGLPECGIALQSLTVSHPRHDALADAYRAIGLDAVAVRAGEPNLAATLLTPRGTVRLDSQGL